MVKRLSCICIVIVLVFLFTIPSFAVDNFQTDAFLNGIGVNYGSPVFTSRFTGNLISADDQYNVNSLQFFVPLSAEVNKLSVFTNFAYANSWPGRSLNVDLVQLVSGNPVVVVDDLSFYSTYVTEFRVARGFRYFTQRFEFTDFSNFVWGDGYFIRISFDFNAPLTLQLTLYSNQTLSGVLSNPTYSLSATQGDHVGTVTSGSLTESGYYITGSLKNKYYNGSSVQTNTGNLTSGTSGSGGYLWVPSHTITATASSPLKMNISGGNISGSLSPSSSSQVSDLSGYNYDPIEFATLNVIRSFDDSDLISAVNSASDRNHADLGRIEDQMQDVVDHMQGLEQQGNEINGTTSQSTINNATGVVNSGTSSMSDTANYVSSGVTSGSAESQGYVQLLGYGIGEIVNFGSSSTPLGVWIWAIIFIPVAFFIFRRISE